MHTGVISFCDRINYNIKSSDTKDDILADINRRYNIQVLQRHWYHLDDKGYYHLARIPHLACLRSNGNPYYMYLTRYEDVPIVYFIDKKVQPNYQKPRILLGRGLWDESLFANTILDGEMVKDNNKKWVFIINDVIGYKGVSLTNKTLPERLEYAFEMLDSLHTPDPIVDCCSYKVKQYSYATQEGVNALIEMSKDLSYTSRGIYFWPYAAKYKPKLVNFDDNLIKSVVRKVKDVPDFREYTATTTATATTQQHPTDSVHLDPEPPLPSKIVDAESIHIGNGTKYSDKPSGTVMWLHKTEFPDVYEVYKNETGTRVKVGTATIPTMKISKMMRAIFKDATVAMYFPFICQHQADSDKWLPIEKVSTS